MADKTEVNSIWKYQGNKVRVYEKNGVLIKVLDEMTLRTNGTAYPFNITPEDMSEWTVEDECRYKMAKMLQDYGADMMVKCMRDSFQGCESASELGDFADAMIKLYNGYTGSEVECE